MTDPLTTIAGVLETADRIAKRAEDAIRFFARAVRRHRRRKARQAAARAVAAFVSAARRGGLSSAEVRVLMAESGFWIGGGNERD